MELIVFDLDGTLLNGASQISEYTRETLLRLTERKIAYTVATGRTLHSAQNIIEGYGFCLPHVYSNGAIIWNPLMESFSLESFLTPNESEHVIRAALDQNITPFILTVNNGEHFVFHSPVRNDPEKRLLQNFLSRSNAHVLPIGELPVNAEITNISMLGEADTLATIGMNIGCEPHIVVYSGPAFEGAGLNWMDVHHRGASKGGAINVLKSQLGFKKIVCFGDSDNDLSMFSMADESYAPSNANDAVKNAATAIIGHHDEDGIARFLRERFHL